MTRLLAIGVAILWLVGCQYQNPAPTYDPFAAAGSQRIPPPGTGFNQSSGYYQSAPAYQPPVTSQPPAATYQPPAGYQPPASSQPPALYQPPAPAFGAPPTGSSPATLQSVPPNSGASWDYLNPANATASRSVPTPRVTPNWPPRRPLQKADELTWGDPQIPGGVRQAAAQIRYGSSSGADRIPTLAPASSPLRPSVVRSNLAIDPACECDPYATVRPPVDLSPIPGGVATYDEAYSNRSTSPYTANQSYGAGDPWRSRQ